MDRNIITPQDADASDNSGVSFSTQAPFNPKFLSPRNVMLMSVPYGASISVEGIPEAVGADMDHMPWVAYSAGSRHFLQWLQYGGSVPGAAYCVGVVAAPYGGVFALYACPA